MIHSNSTDGWQNHSMGNNSIHNNSIYRETLIEQISYTLAIGVFCVWIHASNCTLIRILLKYKITTSPNAAIRIILALTDMLMCSVATCALIPLWSMDNLFHLTFCSVMTDTAYGTGFFIFTIITTLAVERYLYFIKPLKYQSIVKSKYLVCILLVLFMVVLTYFLVSGHMYGHEYKVSELSCPATQVHLWHLGIRVSILFVVPGIIILFALSKMKSLLSNKSSPGSQEIKNSLKKSFRLVILSSGSFYIAAPIYLIRFTIVKLSSTIDIQQNQTTITIIRILTIIFCFLPSAVNPLMQFFVDNNLFIGLQKLFGQSVHFSWQQEIKDIVNVSR